ncbi:MAG: SH3 beta-barrel fold-containing protein [Paludibacteraceae bacterium]
MKSSKNSIAMHYAHILYGKQIITTNPLHIAKLDWKNAVKLAWYFVRLRKKLKNGIVEFSYSKQDGSLRDAKGTLLELLIPEDKKPKGDMSDGAAKPNYKSIAYFDLDKQEWRAFSIDKFIGFVTVYEIKESEAESRKSKDKREK